MITTEKRQLTSIEYFKLIMTIYIKKRWWLYIWIWAMGLFFLCLEKRGSFENFFLYFSIVFPLLFLFQNWRYAHSKDNKIFLLERYYQIDNEKIVGYLSDGSESLMKLENFNRIAQTKKYYILYLSKNQFIYFDKDSFKSEHDKIWFENEILMNIKKNTTA